MTTKKKAAMPKKAPAVDKMDYPDAINTAFDEIETLAEEMRNWHDGMPENLQNGDKGGRVEECADLLENVQYIDLPEELASEGTDEEIVTVAKLPNRASRADRLGWAINLLSGAAEIVKKKGGDEAMTFADELESAVQELEGAEFPGMFG